MAETPVDNALPLPRWLVVFCHWFWKKPARNIWAFCGLIFVSVIPPTISNALSSDSNTAKRSLLFGILEQIGHNWLIWLLVVLVVGLLFFVTYVINVAVRIPSAQTKPEQKQEPGPEQREADLVEAYLRAVVNQVEQLPPLGLGVSDLLFQ
jgi:hypothetical protein